MSESHHWLNQIFPRYQLSAPRIQGKCRGLSILIKKVPFLKPTKDQDFHSNVTVTRSSQSFQKYISRWLLNIFFFHITTFPFHFYCLWKSPNCSRKALVTSCRFWHFRTRNSLLYPRGRIYFQIRTQPGLLAFSWSHRGLPLWKVLKLCPHLQPVWCCEWEETHPRLQCRERGQWATHPSYLREDESSSRGVISLCGYDRMPGHPAEIQTPTLGCLQGDQMNPPVKL